MTLRTVPDKATGVTIPSTHWNDYFKANLDHLLDAGADLASAAALPAPTHSFHRVTGTTTITSITATGAKDGQPLILEFTGALTVTDGSNLNLNSNYVTQAGDVLFLVYDGTNWNEVMRSRAGSGGENPWLVDVDVFHTAVAHVNWDTISVTASAIFNGYKNSSAAMNDEIEFDVVLGAGTWTFELMWLKSAYSGIATLYLDGVSIGTMDTYNATDAYNQLMSITGVVVATSGKKRLKIKITSKNASALSYYGYLQHIQLRRTA